MPYIIFDIVILAILVLFVVLNAKKGFVLALCSLLAVVVAFVGSTFLTNLLAPKVGEYIEPKIAAVIEENLDRIAQEDPAVDGGENAPLEEILQVLKDLGLYQGQLDAIGESVGQTIADTAADAAQTVAATVAEALAYRVLFVILFIIILVAWNILAHALDLVSKLPVLHSLNTAAGGALGLAEGFILLFLAAWVVNLLGNIIPEEAVEQTYLLKFFMTTNPMNLLSGI